MKKVILSATLTVATLFTTSLWAQIPSNGLVARYDFDSAADFLEDGGTNNYDLCNTTNVTMVAGVVTGDNAASFDGNTQHLYYCNGTTSPTSAFTSTSMASVSVWFKTTQTSGYGALTTLRMNGGANNAFCLYIKEGKLAGYVNSASGISGPTNVSDGNWHHAVFTYDNTTEALYLDGVLEISSPKTGAIQFHNDIFTIGKAYNAADNFSGSISQVLYYNRGLSAAEVTAIYNTGTAPCTVTIPDANFKAYLVNNTAINTNGDSEIQCTEAAAFTGTINCGSLNITNLTGIEAFTALTTLYCHNNQLTTLNVSSNTALTQLYCNDNQLTALNVSSNTVLTLLVCYNNLLTSLNVSSNTALTSLGCDNNLLTSLDVSSNTALTNFYCHGNQLTSLNVANGSNTNLTYFWAHNNPNLICIQVDDATYSNTNWTGTNFQKDATASYSENCVTPPCIVTIPDANFKAYLVNNTAINTNGDTEIQCTEAAAFTGTINCANLGIADLTGIEAFTALTVLMCNDNQLTSLDVSNNTALRNLQTQVNQLSTLNISNNTALQTLYCGGNNLTTLNLSANTALQVLYASLNNITTLNVSANTALIEFECYNCKLTGVDLSANPNITNVRVQNNQTTLTSINIANGNNAILQRFDSRNNPLVTCIQVDSTAYSTTNWTGTDYQKDSTASYSDDCSGTVTPTPPAAPTTLSATANTTPLSVSLTWADNATDETGYEVERSTDGTTFTNIASLSANTTSYTDETVSENTTYHYRIYAKNADGNSGFSNVAQATTGTIGVNEITNSITAVYPNPANDFVTISNLPTGAILTILDLTGKEVYSSVTASEQVTISATDFTNGVYVIRLESNGTVANKKLIVNK